MNFQTGTAQPPRFVEKMKHLVQYISKNEKYFLGILESFSSDDGDGNGNGNENIISKYYFSFF